MSEFYAQKRSHRLCHWLLRTLDKGGMIMVPLISQFGCMNGFVKQILVFNGGFSSTHEVVERACQLGYRSLCINDLDGVYGLAAAIWN